MYGVFLPRQALYGGKKLLFFVYPCVVFAGVYVRAAVEGGEGVQGVAQGRGDFFARRCAFFEGEGVDFKASRFAVRFAVHASDEALAIEYRQDEVAMLPLAFGQIAFEAVVEAEELLQAGAVDDEVVEGREDVQEGLSFARRAPFAVYVGVALSGNALQAAGVQACGYQFAHGVFQGFVVLQVEDLCQGDDAMRAEVAVEQPYGVFVAVGRAGVGVGRQQAFGEVVGFFHAVARGDHEVALQEEFVQRAPFVAPVPPVAVAFFAGFRYVAQGERAFAADAVQELLRECFVDVEPRVFAGANALHAHGGKAVITHRQISGGMRPVLEDMALPYQGVEMVGLIIVRTCPQDMMVGAGDDGDGVDLYVTEMFDGAARGNQSLAEWLAARESLAVQRKPEEQSVGIHVVIFSNFAKI